MKNRLLIALLSLVLSACMTHTSLDSDELAEARAVIAAAKAAGAEGYAPRVMAEAVTSLYQAAHESSESSGSEGHFHPEERDRLINRAIAKARQAMQLATINHTPATAAGRDFNSIGFDNNSSWLNRSSASALQQMVATLKQHADLQLIVEGHASTPESEKYNMWLSQRRTQRVINYLVAHGIDAHRLSAKSYGESRLLADESLPGGEAKNRRVELHLSK